MGQKHLSNISYMITIGSLICIYLAPCSFHINTYESAIFAKKFNAPHTHLSIPVLDTLCKDPSAGNISPASLIVEIRPSSSGFSSRMTSA